MSNETMSELVKTKLFSKELEKKVKASEEWVRKSQKKTINHIRIMSNDIKKNQKDMQKEYISILGIFASIVLAFTGGMTFSSSVIENIHKASIYRVTIIALIVGFVFINIIWLLMDFIKTITGRTARRWSWLISVNVQRGGPSTGLPTKSEQTDLLQALFGRNGESPMPVIAAASPTHCFDAAYDACKIALEHMTPVVLLTDGFVANGSGAWKLPDLANYPAINPPYVTPEMKDNYTPYKRNTETGVRYWALPGQEGYMHILGGLEKDSDTGAISTEPENHNLMCRLRAEKIAKIPVPNVKVQGCVEDADLLIVGFGGTYGHLYSAMEEMNHAGKKVALAHFVHLNPLPQNTAEVLKKYKKVVVAEQNLGQFAGYLRMKVDGFVPYQFNEVKGQPFVVSELVDAFTEILNK